MRRAWPLALRAAACAPRGAPAGAAATVAARRGNAGAAGESGGEAGADGGGAAPSAAAAAAAEEEAYVEPTGPVGPPVTPEEAGFPYLLDLTGRGADPAYFRNAHLSGTRRSARSRAAALKPWAARMRARCAAQLAALAAMRLARAAQRTPARRHAAAVAAAIADAPLSARAFLRMP
jgi:hypothetical protein